MSQGWIRVREASNLMGVSQSTVRRRMERGELRGRTGRSGRKEVFLPAKLRQELGQRQAQASDSGIPGHLLRGEGEEPGRATAEKTDTRGAVQSSAETPTPTPTPAPGTGAVEKGAPDVGPGRTPHHTDVLKRYERLAGGSLLLAQQHTDDSKKHAAAAYEQLAHARNQVRQLRRVALAGWMSTAAAVLFGLVLTVNATAGKHKAQTDAAASAAQAEQAEQRAEELGQMLSVRTASAPIR